MSRQLPSTTALLCFEATARLLNVSRAAEELHLSQSAVSHQIRNLESLLDLQLFERVRQRQPFSELADIAEFPLIYHSVQQEVSSTMIWLEAAGLDYRELPGQRFDNFRLVTDAARQDMGVAVVPSFFVEEELARGVLVEACLQRLSTGNFYQLAIAEEKLGSRKVELFRSWILQPGLRP